MEELKSKLQNLKTLIDECLLCCDEGEEESEEEGMEGEESEYGKPEGEDESRNKVAPDKSLLKKTLSKKLSMISGE